MNGNSPCSRGGYRTRHHFNMAGDLPWSASTCLSRNGAAERAGARRWKWFARSAGGAAGKTARPQVGVGSAWAPAGDHGNVDLRTLPATRSSRNTVKPRAPDADGRGGRKYWSRTPYGASPLLPAGGGHARRVTLRGKSSRTVSQSARRAGAGRECDHRRRPRMRHLRCIHQAAVAGGDVRNRPLERDTGRDFSLAAYAVIISSTVGRGAGMMGRSSEARRLPAILSHGEGNEIIAVRAMRRAPKNTSSEGDLRRWAASARRARDKSEKTVPPEVAAHGGQSSARACRYGHQGARLRRGGMSRSTSPRAHGTTSRGG